MVGRTFRWNNQIFLFDIRLATDLRITVIMKGYISHLLGAAMDDREPKLLPEYAESKEEAGSRAKQRLVALFNVENAIQLQ